ncbi:MAG: NlpC/P60 family protein [Janthinobacterium lividum]
MVVGAGAFLAALAPLSAASAAPCTPTGDIGRRWSEMGGSASVLGNCVGAEARANKDGVVELFENGSMYWSFATGAQPVYGAIRAHYADLAWENSYLGFPVTDEFSVPGGRAQHFQGGSVYWSPASGAHDVRDLVRQKWASMGWETSYLGFPTSDEVVLGMEGARLQRFQGGVAYWTAGIGVAVVRGSIFVAWGQRGYEWGDLGFPVSDEYDIPGGKRSDFQFGDITWEAATGRTAVVLTSTVGPWVRPTSVTPGVAACRIIDYAYNGDRVKLVQRRLGIADSEPEWNKGVTNTAIRGFQRANGLPVTGNVDAETWSRLGIGADFCMDGYQQPLQVAPNATAAQRIDTMIAVAQRYLGTEYVWGGTGPVGYGVDCSGLVLQAMLAAGLSPQPVSVALHPLPDYATSVQLYAHGGLRHLPVAQVQRGDLVFYTSDSTHRIAHVAIALGGGKMIEAPNQSAAVRIVDITTKRGAETIAATVVRPFN